MNRFQWIMASVAAVCVLVIGGLAMQSEASWGQLGFAALVFVGILMIPSSFFPARQDDKGKVQLEELDEAVRERISRIAGEGHKIEAIKELRAATGLGLAEAKSIVDQMDQARAEVVDT